MITDQQIRRLRMLIKTEKTKEIAASKAGMDRKTARKYLKNGKMPNEGSGILGTHYLFNPFFGPGFCFLNSEQTLQNKL